MTRLLHWIGYALGGLVLMLLLAGLGTFAAAYWTRYPGRSAPKASATVIEGGQRYVPLRDTVRRNSTVVIESERIACVGDTCTVPKNARRIDASGLVLLPGLIDLHVHVDAPAGNVLKGAVPFASMMWSYVRHRPDVRRAFLQHGVTTVRSVGDPVGHRFGMLKRKRQIDTHGLAGPRLFTTGPTFTAPGGHPAGSIYKGNTWLIRHATRQVTDPDTAQARVRTLAEDGVDGIKVVYDAGSPERGTLPRLDRTVMKATINEAREHGLWVAAHTSTAEEMKHVLETGGVTTIEHGAYRDTLSVDLIAKVRTENVVYVPTLSVIESLTERAGVPDAALRRAQHNVRLLHEAGVPIGAGTDTQGPSMQFGRSLHRELGLLVEAGLSPSEALQAATHVGAKALRRGDTLSRLAPGTPADLLLVGGRPWRNLDALRNIHSVIKEGRLFASEEAPS